MLPTIAGAGIVCSVGYDVFAACAAIRCGLEHATESRFQDGQGEWLHVAAVPFEPPLTDTVERCAGMLLPALETCLAQVAQPTTAVILLVPTGPGLPPDLAEALTTAVRDAFPQVPEVIIQPADRPTGLAALRSAGDLLEQRGFQAVILAGVDTLLTTPIVRRLLRDGRLTGPTGIRIATPGEAAAAVLCLPGGPGLRCRGLGDGREDPAATPRRADGLASAGRAALAEAGLGMHEVAGRIADVQMGLADLKEADLAHRRWSTDTRPTCPLWQPCRSTGLIGAATAPMLLANAWMAVRKDYAAGEHLLIHAGSDDGARSVGVFSAVRS